MARARCESTFQAGQINAMGLIDEVLHLIMGLYRQKVKPQVMTEAMEWLYSRLSEQAVDQALIRFGYLFPALAVYQGESTEEESPCRRGRCAEWRRRW